MTDVTLSPNMSMPVPVVSTTPGPAWATDVNACLSILDQHDHSTGQGVQITPSGININADFALNDNNITTARSVRFYAQTAPLALGSDIGCLYESGVDLYYNDGAGNQVRITQGGSVTGSSGTITGLPSGTASASYSAGTFTFQSATSTPAAMSVGPITIAQNTAGSKTVTIQTNASQPSNFAVTWPASLPAANNYMTLDNTGALSFNAAGSTGTGAVVLTTSPTIVSPTITGTGTYSGIVGLANGSAAAPSLGFTADTLLTGLYRVSANSLGFAANGATAGNYSSSGLWTIGPASSTGVHNVHGQVTQTANVGDFNTYVVTNSDATVGNVGARVRLVNSVSDWQVLSRTANSGEFVIGTTGVADFLKISTAGAVTLAGAVSGVTTLTATTVNATTVAATTLTGAGSGITALNMANASSGTLAVARGGTGVTTSTGSGGSVVLSTSPTLTGTVTVGTGGVVFTSGTLGDFIAGAWNPTLTADSGVSTVTLTGTGRYVRTGNIVQCFFLASVAVTSTSSASYFVSLPVAPTNNFGTSTQGIGVGSGYLTATASQAFIGESQTSTKTINFFTSNPSVGTYSVTHSFMYILNN